VLPVNVARVETVLLIVIIVVGVGGWVVIRRGIRRQMRAEASEKKDKKEAQP
jgi:hypothetical protein